MVIGIEGELAFAYFERAWTTQVYNILTDLRVEKGIKWALEKTDFVDLEVLFEKECEENIQGKSWTLCQMQLSHL